MSYDKANSAKVKAADKAAQQRHDARKHKWKREAPKDAAAEARVTRREWFAERRVVWNLLNSLIAAGFKLTEVNDGEEFVKVDNDPTKALDAVFAVDESHVYVTHPDHPTWHEYIFIVLGNSAEEVVCDYSYHKGSKFEAFMDEFDAEQYAR